MKQSDFYGELESTQHERLLSTPETMFLIETEFFKNSDDTMATSRASETGIIFALGFIATLLFSGGILLHRSLNVTPANLEKAESERTSVFTPKTSFTTTPNEKLDNSQSEYRPTAHLTTSEIEILAIKNAIASGKF